jgi:UDP-GlcNAc:undecaprenyl-phosphate/decaprenyl-phosphate GlcNAc-1-phosphate transferase
VLTYAVAFIVALAVAAMLTPVVTHYAHRFGWLDRPNEARKIHTRAVPRLGGIAVVVAFFAPIIGLAIYTNRISGLIYQDQTLVIALVCGGLSIVGLGVYDDLRGADAKLKLLVQASVAAAMWFAGFRIELLGNPLGATLQLGMWSLPLTMLWIVAVINALNLIDGLDGLAAGIALFTAVVLFGVAFVDHKVLLCLLAAALAGSLAGFLFFNFNPARIFLGDSGSMFLGFILAMISIWTQRKGATAVALVIPVIALGVPLLDTTLSFVRRVAKGQNPFKADREHVHHRLLASGLSHRSTVITLYTVSGVFALGALAMIENDTTNRAIALATVVAVVIIVVRKVGLFGAPAPLASIEKLVALRDEVRAAARVIRRSHTAEHVWAVLMEILPRLDSEEIRLAIEISGPNVEPGLAKEYVYHWRRVSAENEPWRLDGPTPDTATIRMPLGEATERFGELAVLLTEPAAHSPGRNVRELIFEIIRESLIDFHVALKNEGERPALRLAAVPSDSGDLPRVDETA